MPINRVSRPETLPKTRAEKKSSDRINELVESVLREAAGPFRHAATPASPKVKKGSDLTTAIDSLPAVKNLRRG